MSGPKDPTADSWTEESPAYYGALELTSAGLRDRVLDSRLSTLNIIWTQQVIVDSTAQSNPLLLSTDIKIEFTRPVIQLNGRPQVTFPDHDVELVSSDGHRIGANRTRLIAASTAFRLELVIMDHDSVVVNIPVDPLALLVSAIYRGAQQAESLLSRAEFSLQLTIFDAAVQLGVHFLVPTIGRLLCDRSSTNSHIPLMHHLKTECPDLSARLWKRIVADFYALHTGRSFKLLKIDELERLLLHESINIPRGSELLILSGWQKASRTANWMITRVFQKAENSRNFEPKIRELHRQVSSMITRSLDGENVRRPHSLLFALGGWSPEGPTGRLEVFNGYTQSWTEPRDRKGELEIPRSYFAAISMPDSIYVVGGFDGNRYFDGSQRFDLTTMKWDHYSSMTESRCYVNATRLDSRHILACGGYNSDSRHSSAELLDIDRNTWVAISPMNSIRSVRCPKGEQHPTLRSDAHAVELDGRVYVLGGFDGRVIHRSVEFYDPQLDSWTLLAGGMQQRRSGVSALATHGVIMVAGGFTGRHRLNTVEFYDPREGLWRWAAPMANSRSNFGISELRGDPVVVGGYDGRGTIEATEMFEWRTNKWTPLASMQNRRSALSLFRVDGLTNLNELLP